MSETVTAGAQDGPQRGFGRRLFEIRASRDEIAVRVVLCAMALGLTWLLLRRPDSLLDGFLYLIAVGLAAASIMSTMRRGVEVFEEGMVVRTEFGERSVRYDQAARLRFVKIARSAQGISAGTTLHLAVTARSGERVSFSTTLGQDGGGYDVVRDRVAQHIARGLMKQLDDSGGTEWIRRRRLAGFPGFSLTSEGLLVEGFRETLLPYRDLQLRWNKGWLEVHLSGSSKPAARLASPWENFFPGYLVFLEMMRDYLPAAAKSEAGPTSKS